MHNRMGVFAGRRNIKTMCAVVALLERSVIYTLGYTLAHPLPTFGLSMRFHNLSHGRSRFTRS